MDRLTFRSPDGCHIAALTDIGEIRFGPPYYSLRLDKFDLGTRFFGGTGLWSPDSRYFATQEWTTLSYQEGPQTRLVLFDVDEGRECVLSWAAKGFIEPRQFLNCTLIYTKTYQSQGRVNEYEIDFLAVDRWRTMTPTSPVMGNIGETE